MIPAVLDCFCVFQNGSLPFNKFEFLMVWMFHEVQTPYVYLMSHLNPHIQWKTSTFRLKWGGIAESVTGLEDSSLDHPDNRKSAKA